MDREQMQRCVEVVAAYRASGQKSAAWAAVAIGAVANGAVHPTAD